MKKLFAAATLGLAVVLSGCATAPAISVNQLQPNTPYWNTTDASARGVILLPRPGGGMQVCSEPSPDAMLQTVAQLTAQVKLQNPQVDAQTQIQFQTAVIELTKRTTTVVFLREVLYRVCEQNLNQNLNSEQTMQLYQLAMQTALKMAESDLAHDQSKIADALRDPKVRQMWNQLVGPAVGTSNLSSGESGGIVNGLPSAGPVPKVKSSKH
ncbi:MAG: hypothetical protein JST01_22025 [Cyanobacteria bacterium SZAS TMP-1]|nr:hypothetical protein [Cyanobacteria bacterium SZAS TMP-1]